MEKMMSESSETGGMFVPVYERVIDSLRDDEVTYNGNNRMVGFAVRHRLAIAFCVYVAAILSTSMKNGHLFITEIEILTSIVVFALMWLVWKLFVADIAGWTYGFMKQERC
jgi:hypothetical protein